MQEYTYVTLRQKPELKEEAATWFHDKWEVPQEAYLECMESYLNDAMKKDDRERCSWATTELYKEYHDEEWGKPVHDDRKLFEMLVLEGIQAERF